MKRLFRQMAAFLAFCVLAAAVPPVGLAAGGTIHEISEGTDLYDLFRDGAVGDGDTLRCADGVLVAGSHGIDDPWIINKRVTIEGGSLTIGTGGIVLGADVTFQNTQLHFTKPICNAIVANGYALTLDGVTAGSGGYSFNVFCGTVVKNSLQNFKVPPTGSSNEVVIRGNTNLQSGNQTENVVETGNIYAGSLSLGSMDPNVDEAGAASDFAGKPTIRVEGCANALDPLGTVYASGAQQRNPYGVNGKKPTTRDLGKYTVSGTVTIAGTNALPAVDGATSNDGTGAANVVYQGDNNQAPMTFQDISSLSVKSGNLVLEAGSWFRDNSPLSVSNGASVNIKNMGDFSISDFHGGGSLILGQTQTLTITGAVDGETTVGVGKIFNGASDSPTLNHTYIKAQGSMETSFRLAPPSVPNPPVLENDGSGNWIATRPTQEASKLASLNPPANTQVSSGEKEITIPLNPTYTTEAGLTLENLPISVYVNGESATFDANDELGPCFKAPSLFLYIGDWGDGDAFMAYSSESLSPPSDGIYTIQITVSGGEHTATGNPITASCTLTVGDSAPTVTTISVPTANTGLKWTGEEQTGVSEGTGYTLTGHTGTAVGEYTAAATLEPNYQWTGGSADPQTIKWSIAKADGPAAPGNLSATAPTTVGGNDGTITGTTAAMEYATDSGFSGKKPCGEGSTGGLAAGKYYVRVKGTATHEPGAYTSITVPAPGAPTVTGISVSSTGHKTEYKVGESLDVTGLTIDVAYSDGSKQTVPVTEGMVSGFDSSKAAESQTLTITHEGHETTYTIRITASEEPGGTKYQVTLNNLGDGGSGGGSYEEGSTVTIRAGSKSGYTFSAWQQPEGVTLADRNSPETRFTMPGRDVTLLATWTRNDGTTLPGHTHVWSSAWESSAAHHWHDCTASGCTAADNSEKSGYAAHTAGDWVVDRPASSSQSGIRHRSCTVCGYEMARETIPATGGGSSSGGSSSGGNSSSDGSSSSGSSSNTTTVKNPDGSTTATNTNKTTGTVTETTRRPDGSKLVVETKKDGTVTTTDTAKDGSTVKTVARPDGTSETAVKRADGLTASVREDGTGARADVRLPSKLVQEGQSGGGAVALPIPELPGANASVTVRTGSVRPVRVEIPVRGDENTTVACVVNGDGTETILKTAVLTGGQITVSVPDGTTVRLRDNGKDFRDTRGHWAEDAIDFAASRELFAGKTSTAFAPDAPMSRAMLAAVLARLDGVDAAGGAAYEKGMAWAVAQGISDGRNPEGQVTREQFVAMLYRYAGSPAATDRELHFSDEAAISGYAREAVRWAMENGILSGYGNGSFAPGGKATRAQAAVMLTRYVNYLNSQ